MVPSKYLNNFWKTFEMPLINCQINLILTWSANVFTIDLPINNQGPTFTITDTKRYVPSLSTHDNANLLPQLKSGFKRIINQHKYQSKVKVHKRNLYLDYLIDPRFPGVSIIFFEVSFENNTGGASYMSYYLSQVEVKNYDVITIYGQNFLDYPIKIN